MVYYCQSENQSPTILWALQLLQLFCKAKACTILLVVVGGGGGVIVVVYMHIKK